MIAVSDKGTMIELRIDNSRIRTPAPLHVATPLEDPAVRIVAPAGGEFAEVALRARSALADMMGAPVAIEDEAAWANCHGLPGSALAIGHAGNNALLRRLHHLQCLGNADYPAEGLRAMSVHDPFGDGHNVLAALGRSAEVAARGLDRLLQRAVERDGAWLIDRRAFEAEPALEPPDPQALLDSSAAKSGGDFGRPGSFLTALDWLGKSGQERWARAFVQLVTPYALGETPLSFWLMSAVDFWTQRLVVGWARAEPFPYFSDEERLLVANFIASATEYCHDSITYQKWRITEDDHQIFNHHTFPAWGLYFGCMYLRRRGHEIGEIDKWVDTALRVFDRARQAGRSFDEGGAGYSWLVGNHLLEVDLARADTRYAESEKLARYADLAVCIMNNHRELVPFGDCGSYHTGGSGASSILLAAASHHRNAGYKWIAERAAPEAVAADVLSADVPAEPPGRHLGLFVLPMDETIHRWTTLPRFPGYPEPACVVNVPPEEGFDKISLRGGWDAGDDYLLLQGFGEGQHGHPDANSISQFQARGRLFLVDNDYIRRWPRQHNMVMVIRDGRHGPIPVTARLDETREFSGGAMTRTSLLDYNGCDWMRTLLWLSGDCVLVVDTMVARVAGEYELRCYWRTLGEAELTDRGLHADHQGEHFHIIELTGSQRRLDIEGPPVHTGQYPEYKFGDPRPKVLCQSRRETLAQGDVVCFINLLAPGPSASPRRGISRGEDGHVVVSGDGPVLTVGEEGLQLEGIGAHAFADGNQPLRDAISRPARHSRPAAPAVPAVEPAWSAALPSQATCLSVTDAPGALVGCEGGEVVRIGAGGQVAEIARVEGRVGAVLQGCLYGAGEPSVVVTGADEKLHILGPDGAPRAVCDLSGGSARLPAAGTCLCLANLDGDGALWPIVGTDAWRVHAVSREGALRWTFDTVAHCVTCLDAGDLNGDGREEIAAGTVYFCVPAITGDGGRLWEDEDYNDYWTAGPIFPFVHVADVDGDGEPEVITAGSDTLIHCINCRGEKKWTYSIGDDPAGRVSLCACKTTSPCFGGQHEDRLSPPHARSLLPVGAAARGLGRARARRSLRD